MRLEQTVEINAPPERVWAVLSDIERWPEWTASMTSIERIDGEAFEVGSRARVRQPRLPALVWRITSIEPGRSFAWESASAGVKSVAEHRIEPTASGSRVTLSVEQSGPLAGIIGRLFAGMGRRHVDMARR